MRSENKAGESEKDLVDEDVVAGVGATPSPRSLLKR